MEEETGKSRKYKLEESKSLLPTFLGLCHHWNVNFTLGICNGFVLCAYLECSQDVPITHYFWCLGGCPQIKWACEAVDSIKYVTLPNVNKQTASNMLKAWAEQKAEERGNCTLKIFPASLLLKVEHLISFPALDWNWHLWLPFPRLGQNNTTGLQFAENRLGLLGFHNHMSQFLIIKFHISYWIYFSEELTTRSISFS